MAGRIPENIIDEVSRRTDILDVVGSYVNLSRKGNRWWGLCPFHNEKTPSFSVSPDKNIFYCFGCHKGGGSYQFLMEMESLNFPEAVRRLAEKAGVDIPDDNGGEEYRDNRRALEDLYKRVSNTFRWLYINHENAAHARDYLDKRGISEETAEYYQIGWAPRDGEWLYNFLLKKKYSSDFLAESGLFSPKSPRWSYFVDRLMFPVMPDSERVVAFSGRALNGKEPKYINSPETVLYKKSRQLYGLGQARKKIRENKHVVICEGNLDVLSCMQADSGNIVAPLGTAFTQDQAGLIKRQADSITLLFDGDDAGRKATVKAAILAESVGLAVNAVKIPPGTDPSDILCNQGPETLKKLIERPINIFDYLLDFLISAKTDNTGEAQEEALKELTPYLDAVGSDVRREKYLRQLADEVNADPVTVIREYRNNRGKKLLRTSRLRSYRSTGVETETVFEPVDDELYLMTAVAVKTEHFTTLRKSLAPEIFRDRRALSVYRVMDELSVDGRELRTDVIVSKLDDEKMKSYILEKAAAGIYDQRADDTIKEKIRILQIRTLNDERLELQKLMDKENDTGLDSVNPMINNARMKRILEIDKEIQAR
ncbi:MAG: DNA primase [Spirochaetes bacterium]|nr:MAG: DNA primase [Spirochaetota bacterium]